MHLSARLVPIHSRRFPIIALLICLLIAGVCPAFAADVVLTWGAPNQYVDGYRVYCARAGQNIRSGRVREIRPMQQTSCTITGLEPGTTYTFAASSILENRESQLSAAVQYQVPEEDGSSTGTAGSTGDGGCFIRVLER